VEQQTTKQNLNIQNDLTLLKSLEKAIAHNISPLLLDYIPILAPEKSLDINLKKINPKTADLLVQYINAGNQLLTKLKIPAHTSTKDLLNDYLDVIHDIYLLRFVNAKAIYAKYELYRIPTQFEIKIQELQNTKKQPDIQVYSLNFPDGLIINKQGDVDWQATIQAEQSEHLLARHLTAFKKAKTFAHQMFIDLQAITTKALAYPIFEKELMEMTEAVIEKATFFFSKDVHHYLDKKYSLEDSIVNVYEYYSNIAKQGNKQLMGELNSFFNEITTIINTSLGQIKDLNSDTKAAILDDYLELIISYIKTKLLLPTDYYQMIYRDEKQLHESEKGEDYNHILDFMLYVPEGGVTEFAYETFVVDFTTDAKFFIYQTVVGDNINPQLTLKNYLRV
jgi:hypothetical protein